ncbi:MAG: MBL fold metallo-hydrolase [Thiohalocapsa sp.]|jgi:ribonuclease BN (tRNA processing enzyme)
MGAGWPVLPCAAPRIIDSVLDRDRRVLLFGPPGIGKSTLAAGLADALAGAGRPCRCVSADPGSPGFGPPGAVALGARHRGRWSTLALEPLCTLDAGRFRLPLVAGLQRLLRGGADGSLLIDAPGVVRGAAGRELLQGLIEVGGVDLVLALTPCDDPPLADELAVLSVECVLVRAADEARRPGRRERARARTARWDTHLADGALRQLELDGLRLTGTPPPVDEPAAWVGRQVALLRAGAGGALGEVVSTDGGLLTIRVGRDVERPDALLVRDAVRNADGLLESAVAFARGPIGFRPPAQRRPTAAECGGPRPMTQVGSVDALLVNGIFGDPLLHLRLRHLGRSLLFDLGGDGRLSARVAHQVTDVFVTHAHMDHLSGFLWLLRSRIGDLPTCRIYGPPGLAGHVRGLVEGFLWDRIGDNGPAFEVAELCGGSLHRYFVRAGRPGRRGPEPVPAPDGVLLQEPGFRVRAIVLDHHTPVLAFAFEPEQELNVRRDRLETAGLSPGPWLNELKSHLRQGNAGARLSLPDGTIATASDLGRELVMRAPGRRLVYATDLADTPANRKRLIALARNAHTLFLEATFTEADRARASAHAHLTGRACGEIAEAAGVARLVPFHLSRRYAHDPIELFDEIRAACSRALLPRT